MRLDDPIRCIDLILCKQAGCLLEVDNCVFMFNCCTSCFVVKWKGKNSLFLLLESWCFISRNILLEIGSKWWNVMCLNVSNGWLDLNHDISCLIFTRGVMGVSCVDCMTVVLSGWSCVCVQQCMIVWSCFHFASSFDVGSKTREWSRVLITECQILLLQNMP